MVESLPHIELATHWFPTRASGERSFLMQLEFSLNAGPRDQPTIAEVAWASGDINRALSIIPSVVPQKVRREAHRLLQPWPDGRYTGAFQRSGGILNLFTPPWGEEQDEVWTEMLTEWKAASFSDGNTRQEALRELEQRWNHTPHPFFAGLTPAQVMVGGSYGEAKLAREFLIRLKQTFDGQPFESEGESLVKTLMLLRGWSCQPGEDGWTPVDIIVTERNELLVRRERALTGD